MSLNIPRRIYADIYGPTTGGRVRLADNESIVEVVGRLKTQMAVPPDSRRTVIDAHAHYEGRPHTHTR